MPNLLKTEGSADGRDIIVYAGTVTDAFFTENEYGQSLGVRSRLDDNDLLLFPWMESGEHTRYFKLGKIAANRNEPRIAWTILGDGTAVKGDTDDRMFRADSDLGRLIDQLAKLPNVATLPDDFDPRVAASWKALGHVVWAEVTVTKSMPTGEKTDKGRDEFKPQPVKMVLPVEFGTGGATVTAPVVAVDLISLGLTDEQRDALSVINAAAASDAEFQSKSLGVPGVMGNQAYVKAVQDNPAGVRNTIPF